MDAKQALGVGPEQVDQPKGLIDLVEVIEPIVVADDLAEVSAAGPDQAVVVVGVDQPSEGKQRVGQIEDVGQHPRARPRVVANAVDHVLTLAAPRVGDSGRIGCIELGRPLAGQRVQRGDRILRMLGTREQRQHVAEAVGEQAQHQLGEPALLQVVAQKVGQLGPAVGAAHGGHRGDQLGRDRGHIADIQAPVAVADQVDLGRPADRQDLLDLGEQNLAADLGRVELRDLGDIHLRPAELERVGNGVEILVDAEELVEARHSVTQDNGVFCLGIVVGNQPCIADTWCGQADAENSRETSDLQQP